MGFPDSSVGEESTCNEEKKMVEESVDVGSISLHGYIRNTPSDTAAHAERKLRMDRGT